MMDAKRFNNDRMKLSPYNYCDEVVSRLNLPRKLTLCDATLREGAQGSIIGLTLEEKIQILQKAYDTGVRYIQIGTTREYDDLQAIMKYIKDNNLQVTTEVMVAEANADFRVPLDRAIALGVDVIDIMGFFTEYGLVVYGGMENAEKVYQLAIAQIQYVVSRGVKVSYDPMDGPRTDFNLLLKLYRGAIEAGAQQIRLLDTVGSCSPAAWRYLISTLRREFPDVNICVHCHNDFGQVMANVYASIEAGANVVDVCINGLGERSGNAPLASVAAGAELLYGVDTGIKLEKLTELTRLVEEITNRKVDRNSPIVGEWAFCHGDEGHTMILKMSPWAFEAIHADVFGNRQFTLLGPMAGPVSARNKLTELGYTEDEFTVSDVTRIFEEVCRRTKAEKRVLSDDEIRAIAEELR